MKRTKSSLHSNMDRFERLFGNVKEKFEWVYIPIWIDLKAFNAVLKVTRWTCLHSNMDKLESTSPI